MKLTLSVLSLCLLLTSCALLPSSADSLETTVCGPVKEPLVFWLWNRVAGVPNPASSGGNSNVRDIDYRTVDGRLLHGYKLSSTATDNVVRGSVLLAQGNAMLADQLLQAFTDLNEAGLDVYVFDYRGYGRSEGKRRLKAIVSDYKELYNNVIPKDAGKRLLYGISFGGIVVSNVIGEGMAFDRAVIDSSPSRLSVHGCEPTYDPVNNLLHDAPKVLVVAGKNDFVVKPADSEELRESIAKHGGKAVLEADYAHPFMDTSEHIRKERQALIRKHLLD